MVSKGSIHSSFLFMPYTLSNPPFFLTALSCPNGPDRIIYVPKCGLQTNYIYNWILRNSFISQNSINRDQLKKIIETCKTLYSEFDDKRREIRAEKAKRIRELTDPDHAWDAVPEEGGAMSPTFGGQYRIFLNSSLTLCANFEIKIETGDQNLLLINGRFPTFFLPTT